MAIYTVSPNMNLRIPTVGQELGPDYAYDVNADLSIVDIHDHTPGRGVQITPSGLNINADLNINSNFINTIAGLTLTPQGSTPAINTIYESGVDLFYVDGLGNDVRITQAGGLAGTPGSISNLTAPASVNYVSGSQTFVFQSDIGIAANIDAGAYLFRNLSPNSTNAITLQAPALLASNYAITLPLLPAQNSFMALDQFGVMSAVLPISGGITTTNINASANIIGTQLSPSANILGSQLSAAANIIGTQLSASASILGTQLSPTANILPTQINAQPRRTLLIDMTANGTLTVPTGVEIIFVEGCGGGQGGTSAQSAGVDTAGGWGAQWISQALTVTPGANYTVTIGTGGAGGGTGGAVGAAGTASTFGTSLATMITFPGANSATSAGYATNSPQFAQGSSNTFNPGITALGGAGGPFGVGANGRAGNNNFTGFSAAANTGAGGGSAHSQGGGAVGGAGGSGRVRIFYYTLQV